MLKNSFIKKSVVDIKAKKANVEAKIIHIKFILTFLKNKLEN